MKILILRPQPGASQTARRVERAGMKAVITPLFTVRPLAWNSDDVAQHDCLLLSSANAIIHGGPGLHDLARLPVYAVGPVTARAAEEAGMTIAATGDEGAQLMFGHMRKNGHFRPLWLSGLEHGKASPGDNMSLDIRPVYAAEKLPPPPELIEELARPNIAMLHSARAARYFGELANDRGTGRGHIIIGALSPQIADAAGKGWKDIIIPDRIDDARLIASLATCFTNWPPSP